MSLVGTGLDVSISTYQAMQGNNISQNIGNIISNGLIHVAGETVQHYSQKIPDFDELGKQIIKQNVGLKIMLLGRYYNNKNK